MDALLWILIITVLLIVGAIIVLQILSKIQQGKKNNQTEVEITLLGVFKLRVKIRPA